MLEEEDRLENCAVLLKHLWLTDPLDVKNYGLAIPDNFCSLFSDWFAFKNGLSLKFLY